MPVCSILYKETWSEFSELFPLLGNENMSCDIGLSKDKFRTFRFKYYSYDSTPMGQTLARSKEIMTTWIDASYTKLRNYPMNLYYSNTTGSGAANSIVNGIVPIDIENSKGTHDIFLNNMVIGEALKYLATRSYSSEGSTFLFYKNGDRFKFHSRNTAMRQAVKFSFIYGYNMTHFTILGNDRSLFTNPVGTVIGYSYKDGQVFEYTKMPGDVKGYKTSFGRDIPYGDGTEISPRFVYDGTRHTHEAEGKAMASTEAYMDSAMMMTFTALGEPFLSCGDVIDIQIGSSLKEYGKFNLTLSGKWLVERIVHFISNYQYMMRVWVTKGNVDFSRRRTVL